MTLHTPTPKEWRAAMGSFPSGVTVITTWDQDQPVGSTVSAFCSVSLDPPLLLVCLDNSNPILGPVQASGVFGVNILNDESGALALHFADPNQPDRFEGNPYRAIESGAPQLACAPVFIDCKVEQSHLAGDHHIIVGRGMRVEHASTHPPLLYHKGGFLKLV